MLKLKDLRNEKGTTLDQLAASSGVSKRMISAYEAGENDITLSKLQNIANALGVSVSQLIGETAIIELNESIPIYGKEVPFWNLPVSAGRSIKDIIGASKPDGFISGLPGVDIAENILPVTGTSMEPEISPGAIIGVRLMNNYDTLNTERIYLIITSDDRMIKRIEHDSENEDILWCVSPNYPRFNIYKSDIIEIQRVCFVYNTK